MNTTTKQAKHRQLTKQQLEMFHVNVGLVYSTAKKFWRYRNIRQSFGSFDDLVQVGKVVLLRCVRQFDHNAGWTFSTYAVRAITNEINKEQSNGVIAIPANMVCDVGRVAAGLSKLHDASDACLEKAVRTRLIFSLGSEFEGDLFGNLEDGRFSSPQAEATKRERRRLIFDAMRFLTPREQEILRARFGLDGGRPLRLEDIGEKYGVTKERVRQLQVRALRKLSDHLSPSLMEA